MVESDFLGGAVSLWIGWTDSEASLAPYADFDHPHPAGRSLASDFGTGRYDHDFLEMGLEKPTRKLSELLRGCSYDAIVIPKFVELCGDVLAKETNAFILLYNFRYTGAPGTEAGTQKSLPKFRYVGSIAVDMPWPE